MGRGGYAGFNDLITFANRKGSDEQMRVQWGYSGLGRPRLVARLHAADDPAWNWDRPTDETDLRRYPSAAFTRIIKFPSTRCRRAADRERGEAPASGALRRRGRHGAGADRRGHVQRPAVPA